jgi:thiol-disulfide isomerase/thioredoxin
MGRIRQMIRGGIRRVSDVVARNELFEQPGERTATAPLAPREPQGQAAAPVEPPARPPSAPPASSKTPREQGLAQEIDSCEVVDLDGLNGILGPGSGVRVVNHWATWCIPCIEEFDLLKTLFEQLPTGASFHGISWDLFDPRGDEDDIAEHVVNFATGHALPWESVLIGEAVEAERFFEAFSIANQTIPQTWVINRSGQVVHRVDGAVEASHVAGLVEAVNAAIRAEQEESG